jgi:TPP-dependent trihydroxycyclohexane-1,2-dione (THcHDO) dehydratase
MHRFCASPQLAETGDQGWFVIDGYEGWWDVPVAEVSEMAAVQAARAEWESMRAQERYFLG